MFDEILVIDYVSSYSSLTDEQKSKLSDLAIDPGFLVNCPNGTIIGQIVANNRVAQPRVFYPFFSHMRVPIKAGERAWGFTNNGGQVSYWLSRKVQNGSAEDLNFTHDDRAFFASNVDPITNSRLFLDADTSGADLEKTRREAFARTQFTGKPTVSLPSKSPDLLLQGSNSTAIILTDIGGAGTIILKSGLKEDRQADQAAVQNVDGYKESIKPYSIPATSLSDTSVIEISAPTGVTIRVGSASIQVLTSGDIVITPSDVGVIKLGGADADKAILCQTAVQAIPGNITAAPVISTAGGIIGSPSIAGTGLFASKILVK